MPILYMLVDLPKILKIYYSVFFHILLQSLSLAVNNYSLSQKRSVISLLIMI
jgi:hypothetical protein